MKAVLRSPLKFAIRIPSFHHFMSVKTLSTALVMGVSMVEDKSLFVFLQSNDIIKVY